MSFSKCEVVSIDTRLGVKKPADVDRMCLIVSLYINSTNISPRLNKFVYSGAFNSA